jgi:hypothetical protein
LHIGFELQVVKWIMVCVTIVFFSILINGVGSSFFKAGRGLIKGYPLSLYLFFLVVEGLSRVMEEARRTMSFQGISFGNLVRLTHLLFVDDVLIFFQCTTADCLTLKNIMTFFSVATSMIINGIKSTIYLPFDNEDFKALFSNMFPFSIKEIMDGLKYLNFTINPNKYCIVDWSWLVSKVDWKFNQWCNRWISKGRKLVLIKAVLEAIPMYRHLMTMIPKGILT